MAIGATKLDFLDGQGARNITPLSTAPVFSSSASYAVGDLVYHEGVLYKCTTAHSGVWSASHFTAVTIGSELQAKAGEIDDLKSDLSDIVNSNDILPVQTVIEKSSVTGNGISDNNHLDRTDYVPILPYWDTVTVQTHIHLQNGNSFYLTQIGVLFYDENKSIVGFAGSGTEETVTAKIPVKAKYMMCNLSRWSADPRFIKIGYATLPKVYHVGTGKDYTSFTACIYALKDDDSDKIIYVHGGEYDIFAEYRALGITRPSESYSDFANYMPYNVMIPPNTHIIGLGQVTLSYMPTSSQTYASESKLVSPLNMTGDAIIENITVKCKNGRYALHDDTLGMTKYAGAQHVYKNLTVERYANDTGLGYSSTIGLGIDGESKLEFDGCRLWGASGRAFYVHDRYANESGTAYTKAESGNIIIKDCIIDGNASNSIACFCGLMNSVTALYIPVKVTNTYFNGWIRIADESNGTGGTNPNVYDFTLINCNDVGFDIKDASNVYTPKKYNTIG